jgi:WD40 repeat protein
VLLWKPDGTLLQTLHCPSPVGALAWSPDGRQLAVGAATTVSFFDAQGGVLLAANATQHTAALTALGWTDIPGVTPLVISAGLDKTAWVWNGQTHRPQMVFRHHTAAIEALSVLAETVATASQGGVTRVWQALNGQEVHGYYASSRQPNRSVAFSSQGALVVGSEDGSIALWNDGRTCMLQVHDTFGLHCLDQAHRLQGHTRAVRALAFSPDGKLLATGGDDHRLILWSMRSMTPLLMQPQQDTLSALAWSPSGRLLAGALGTRVVLWQIHE